jgi:hypothetical protein
MPALERSRGPERADGSAAGASEERGHDVGGVSVEGHARSVVPHGGAGIGVAGGLLHIPQRNPGVQRGGDESVAERVGPDTFGDAGPSGDAAHDPSRRVAVDPTVVGSDEDRSLAAFTDREINGPRRAGRQRDGHDLATLAQDRERAVAALQAEVLDIGADGFGDPQPVEREQADQGVIPGAGQAAATSMAPTSLRSRPVAWES